MSHTVPNFTETPADEIKLRKSSEEREQSLVYRWSTKQSVREACQGIEWLYHCPNGGKRDKVTANKLKAMGVKKGIPDLQLNLVRKGYNGIAIEMKDPNGRLEPEQKECIKHYMAQNWLVYVCYSAVEAHAALCNYFDISPTQYPL